jgi:hypothetical protein
LNFDVSEKESNSRVDRLLSKVEKKDRDKLFKYLEILNILVDIPSFNALKIEDDQLEQNFHMFFFFLISCKYKLARYVFEQIIV